VISVCKEARVALLILLRHGLSEWNKRNIFTGWIDIPLSPEGLEEALQAGNRLKDTPIDSIHSSLLIRSIMTALLAMTRHSSKKIPLLCRQRGESLPDRKELIPMICAEELNERSYGLLQGKDKDEMRRKYGEKQVELWRRSYSDSPPEGESLEKTSQRVLPYFEREILRELKQQKNVLVSAHGNSLRAIIRHIEDLSEQETVQLEVPTGHPLFYRFAETLFTPLLSYGTDPL
jgi:2,3-bisphosphoglycerate-dependent phosphoglycerate mutase